MISSLLMSPWRKISWGSSTYFAPLHYGPIWTTRHSFEPSAWYPSFAQSIWTKLTNFSSAVCELFQRPFSIQNGAPPPTSRSPKEHFRCFCSIFYSISFLVEEWGTRDGQNLEVEIFLKAWGPNTSWMDNIRHLWFL